MDTAKMEAFVGQVVNDMAASMSGVMVNLGHKLGLYRAMSGAGALTPLQLAEHRVVSLSLEESQNLQFLVRGQTSHAKTCST